LQSQRMAGSTGRTAASGSSVERLQWAESGNQPQAGRETELGAPMCNLCVMMHQHFAIRDNNQLPKCSIKYGKYSSSHTSQHTATGCKSNL
jgi:hypothetical protein